jgi:hypothetical protein
MSAALRGAILAELALRGRLMLSGSHNGRPWDSPSRGGGSGGARGGEDEGAGAAVESGVAAAGRLPALLCPRRQTAATTPALGCPILEEALAVIQAEPTPRTVSYWVKVSWIHPWPALLETKTIRARWCVETD